MKMSALSLSNEVVEVVKSGGFVAVDNDDHLQPASDPVPDEEDRDDDLLDPSIEIRRHPTRIIIIEPVLAFFVATFTSSNVLTSQLAYALVSVHYNFTKPENGSCGDLDPVTAEKQQEVQSRSALLVTYFNVCGSVTSIAMVFVWGAYSDRVGRKTPILLALCGQIIRFVIMIITMTFRASFYFILVAAAFDGVFGGASSMGMSCMAYISDTSSHADRTIRLTAIEVSCGVCAALAQILVGFAITQYGFIIPLYAMIASHTLNAIYVFFFVPEVRFPTRSRSLTSQQVFRTFRLYSSSEDGNRTPRLLCLFALLFCTTTVVGRFDPLILYTLNSPFCWSPVLLGLYVAWTAFSSQIGQIALVASLCNRIGEMGVAVIGCLSGLVYFILLAFCKSTLNMFLVVFVGVGSFAPGPMVKALKSKLTSPHDQGALFAGTAAMDTLCGLLASFVFNPIYSASVSYFSGLVFLVMAAYELGALVMVIVLGAVMRRREPIQILVSNVDPDDLGQAT